MKDLNILDNKNFKNFLILIFSSLPISIILGNALMEINILLIIFSFIVFILSNKKLINDIKNEKLLHLLVIFWAYLILNSFFGIDFTKGTEDFDPSDIDAMVGTYWYDPCAFMEYIKKSL